MVDDVYKNLSKQHIKETLIEQTEDNLYYKPHRLNSSIDNEQIDIDLNILFKESD